MTTGRPPSPLAGFNELRARAADDQHELLILKVRAERVRQLHQPVRDDDVEFCDECNHDYPCRTIRIHDGLDGDDWGEGPGSVEPDFSVEEMARQAGVTIHRSPEGRMRGGVEGRGASFPGGPLAGGAEDGHVESGGGETT